MELSIPHLQTHGISDYSAILRSRAIKFTEVDDHYYQVGTLKREQGWILHVSAVKAKIQKLFALVIPELLRFKIPFKITKNATSAEAILSGSLGLLWLGKIIRIYPNDDRQALEIAQMLIALTKGFTGPAIHTDSYLGGTVYTRYGAFNGYQSANEFGHLDSYIKDSYGRLVRDPNEVPFRMFPGEAWPFESLAMPAPIAKLVTLYNRYLVTSEIKNKPKGRVFKALRIKGLTIRAAIIKESKQGMCDDLGRDLADRLNWQYSLYTRLREQVRVPFVFDQFGEEGNKYLAMEYVRGRSLGSYISQVYRNRSWADLSLDNKLSLLDMFGKILSIVKILHKNGVVHRDLTPENFMVKRNGEIVLIDLELAYDVNEGSPFPPYRLGTVGYMSPEQIQGDRPSFREDIFALGGLMIILFTNISPAKFNLLDKDTLSERLKFFNSEEKVILIIERCLHLTLIERPSLADIEDVILEIRSGLARKTRPVEAPVQPSTINNSINTSRLLQALASPPIASKGVWRSNSLDSKNEGVGRDVAPVYPGFHTGISGILTTISRAKLAGIDFGRSVDAHYRSNLKYLDATFISRLTAMPTGLNFGTAGVAFALVSGIQAGLIDRSQTRIETIKRLLSNDSSGLSLSAGAAGRGLSSLKAYNILGDAHFERFAASTVSTILARQNRDGSWTLDGRKNPSLFDGAAGITLYLLNHQRVFPSRDVLEAVDKALGFLSKYVSKNSNLFWRSRSLDRWHEVGFGYGVAGMCLVLLCAYDVLNDARYLQHARTVIAALPSRMTSNDFSVATGLTGIGEVLLEAYRLTRDESYRTRIEYLLGIIRNGYYSNNKIGHWVMRANQPVTGDLMTGNGGPLHLLIRANNFDHLGESIISI